MQLILEQSFPLGRFHATPWKAFPYDDPHGEWPPSPWRLVRAVLSRSFQLDREIADSTANHATLREALVRAFATSEVSWQLPASSWRGPGLRQYQPAEFDWGYAQPAKKTLITLSVELAGVLGGPYALQDKKQPDTVEVFDAALRSLGFRSVNDKQASGLTKLAEGRLIALSGDLATTLGGPYALQEKKYPDKVEVFDGALSSLGFRSVSDEQTKELTELAKKKSPKPKKLKRYPPDGRSYNTTKVLDNFWVTSDGDASQVVWLFNGPEWTDVLLSHLDACLARMTYFGRAESLTEIRRLPTPPVDGPPLVTLHLRRTGNAVPVLALKPDASIAQLEATTDAPSVKDTNIPPGSRWMFAERPARPAIKPIPRSKPALPPVSLIQFAIGSKVAPRYRDTVLITERFRNGVLGCFTKVLTGYPKMKWGDAPNNVREQALLLSGRDANGKPATGHHHVSFLLFGTEEAPSRLCAWRAEPFTDTEQRAILDAAITPLPLNYKDDPWTLTLVPLDKLVPPPPGLDGAAHRDWKSLTPYVPPRHVYGRSGKEKPGCSVQDQIMEEFANRGVEVAGLTATIARSGWVKIHRFKSAPGERTNNDKLGYTVKLSFREPAQGPISLGASCHFGLGLFVPTVPAESHP